MKKLLIAILFLCTLYAQAATKVFMHDVTSTYNTSYRDISTALGPGVVTGVTNSVTGPTAGVQQTKTAGGSVLTWISPKIAAAVTISGTVTFNGWGLESATACNCGFEVKVIKFTGGAEGATIIDSEFGTELGTVNTVNNWTGAPTSTALAIGDQIVVKWLINDAGGTMASGRTTTLNYDGTTAAASGDTWVQFNETIQFTTQVINVKSGNTNSGTSVATATWSVTHKSLVACAVGTFVSGNTDVLNSVTDSLGNTFTLTAVTTTVAHGHLKLGYFKEIGSDSGTYSVTANVTPASFISIVCMEFFSPPNTYFLDVGPFNGQTTGNQTSISTTLTNVTADDIIFAGSTNDAGGSDTAGTGFTLPAAANNIGGQPVYAEYDLGASTGNNTAAITQPSTSGVLQALAFKLVLCPAQNCVYPVENFTFSDGPSNSGTRTSTSYTWTTPTVTGTPQGNIWNWGMEYCPSCKGLLTHAQQDLTGGSPIYSNAIYTYNATSHAFTQNYSGPANSSTCNADSGTTPENRHPYAQHWFNTVDGTYQVISGSCGGGIGYDRIVFAPSGSSGSWTIPSVPGTNPGVRQEGCAAFVPGTDVPSGHDSAYTFSQIGTNLNDTWLLDLSSNTWTTICNSTNNGTPPVCNVPQHGGCALAYDHTVKKLITFGGYSGGTSAGTALSNTTWQLDVTSTAANWVQSSPATDFPASDYPCWGWDSNRRRILVWTNGNQLWSYTTWNNNWLQLTTSGTAPTISGSMWLFSCGYDATADKFIEMDSNAVVVHELSFGFDGIPKPSVCNLMLTGVC